MVYVFSYAIIRFVLEFFRGDAERGGFLSISTSQWISIALVAGVIALFIYLRKKEKNKREE